MSTHFPNCKVIVKLVDNPKARIKIEDYDILGRICAPTETENKNINKGIMCMIRSNVNMGNTTPHLLTVETWKNDPPSMSLFTIESWVNNPPSLSLKTLETWSNVPPSLSLFTVETWSGYSLIGNVVFTCNPTNLNQYAGTTPVEQDLGGGNWVAMFALTPPFDAVAYPQINFYPGRLHRCTAPATITDGSGHVWTRSTSSPKTFLPLYGSITTVEFIYNF